MRFTLRQLEYFLAAAEAGSVTEAAQNIPAALPRGHRLRDRARRRR
jgi:hypothetical protein